MSRHFSKLRPQYQPSHNVERFVIEIDLTPPSSPELSDSASDLDSDDEIDELSLDYSQTSSAPNSYASSQTSLGSRSLAVREPKPLSVLGQLLNAYRAAKRNKGVMRQSVIDHIHSNAVSLADVQLLTPDYKHDYGFINKLSSTIAYHCAAGRISDADKETIFTHIFTHDDERSDVYNRVHARIEHFQKNMKHLHTAQRNRTLREKQERQQEEQSLATRIQEFPAHLRAPVPNPEFLPIGATTVADMYVKLLGLTWNDVRRLKPPASLTKQQPNDTVEVPDLNFAATRPLYPPIDQHWDSRPKVNIPPAGLHSRTYTFEYPAWITTKSWKYYDRLSKRPTAVDGTCEVGEPIRVRLPPANCRVKLPSCNYIPGAANNLHASVDIRLNFLALGS